MLLCLPAGMDVSVTLQTPVDSLVLTTGCFHQILNLTAVEGWSCNFLPPCMLPVVDRVRGERAKGWHWNYDETGQTERAHSAQRLGHESELSFS